ncbi:MAG: YtxH domain-containing protein [Muribaculaceae bacterium]
MKHLGIILAALGGAVAGAAVATLFAPKSGAETRDDIRRFVRKHCPFAKEESEIDKIVDSIKAQLNEK